jgi:hypothetical protein
MDKRTLKDKIEYDFNWKDGVEIDQMQKDLEALKELGATHVEVDSITYSETELVAVEAFCERLETDEEYRERMEGNKKYEDTVRAIELKQLKELKEKYEK